MTDLVHCALWNTTWSAHRCVERRRARHRNGGPAMRGKVIHQECQRCEQGIRLSEKKTTEAV